MQTSANGKKYLGFDTNMHRAKKQMNTALSHTRDSSCGGHG